MRRTGFDEGRHSVRRSDFVLLDRGTAEAGGGLRGFTIMIVVYGIQKASSTTYRRSAEGFPKEGIETVEEYIEAALADAPELDLVTEEDEEYERIQDADGRTYEQHGGVIVAFRDRNTGMLFVDLLCEEDRPAIEDTGGS